MGQEADELDNGVIFLRGIDKDLKRKFKAWCCLQNKSMTEVLTDFMKMCTKAGDGKKSKNVVPLVQERSVRDQSVRQSAKHSLSRASTRDNKGAKRFKIFGKPLTPVVKAMRLDGMSLRDVSAVVEHYATPRDFAPATVTTAYSDAMNDKYRRHVATLTDYDRRQINKVVKAISHE